MKKKLDKQLTKKSKKITPLGKKALIKNITMIVKEMSDAAGSKK